MVVSQYRAYKRAASSSSISGMLTGYGTVRWRSISQLHLRMMSRRGTTKFVLFFIFFLSNKVPDTICHLPSRVPYHILRKLVPGKVLDVLVLGVDDLGQLSPVRQRLLKDPHPDLLVHVVAFLDVGPDDLGDRGPPWMARKKKWQNRQRLGKTEQTSWKWTVVMVGYMWGGKKGGKESATLTSCQSRWGLSSFYPPLFERHSAKTSNWKRSVQTVVHGEQTIRWKSWTNEQWIRTVLPARRRHCKHARYFRPWAPKRATSWALCGEGTSWYRCKLRDAS